MPEAGIPAGLLTEPAYQNKRVNLRQQVPESVNGPSKDPGKTVVLSTRCPEPGAVRLLLSGQQAGFHQFCRETFGKLRGRGGGLQETTNPQGLVLQDGRTSTG